MSMKKHPKQKPKTKQTVQAFIRYYKKKVLRTDSCMAPYIEKHHPELASIRGNTEYFYQKIAIYTVSARLAPRMVFNMVRSWKKEGQILTHTTLTKDMAKEEWTILYRGYTERIDNDFGIEAFKKMSNPERVRHMNRYARREVVSSCIFILVYIFQAKKLGEALNWLYNKFFDAFK